MLERFLEVFLSMPRWAQIAFSTALVADVTLLAVLTWLLLGK